MAIKKAAKKTAKKTKKKAAKTAAKKSPARKSAPKKAPAELKFHPGDLIADFTLQDQDGHAVSLSSFAGKPVLLFVYPRADTPGCTIEACGFRDSFKQLQAAGVVILGLSRDDVRAQKKFQLKYDLPYTLLADPDMKLINYFGLVQPKNMYGKWVTGVRRTTFLIGPDRRLLHVFPDVTPEGHAEEVLACLRQ